MEEPKIHMPYKMNIVQYRRIELIIQIRKTCDFEFDEGAEKKENKNKTKKYLNNSKIGITFN